MHIWKNTKCSEIDMIFFSFSKGKRRYKNIAWHPQCYSQHSTNSVMQRSCIYVNFNHERFLSYHNSCPEKYRFKLRMSRKFSAIFEIHTSCCIIYLNKCSPSNILVIMFHFFLYLYPDFLLSRLMSTSANCSGFSHNEVLYVVHL